METKKQVRIEYIDIFRGFGIILMLMGHVGYVKWFDHFFHAFHMPMFFFVSGMFFNLKTWDIRKKIKSLLVPYAFFAVFHYIVWLIINRKNAAIAPIKSILLDNTKGLPIAGALWFLTALFWAEAIYFLIMKFVKNNILRHIIVAAIALFGCFATKILPFRLPWALDASFVGIGLMHIGSLIKNNMDNKLINALFNLKIPVWFALAAGTAALIFVNGYINMRLGEYAFVPLFWINLLLSVIVGINLSKYVNKLPIKKFNSALIYCGKNSIVFVCLNQFVILFVGRLINMIEGIPSRLAETIIFALSAAILYCLTYVITNTKLKVLIGKF